MSRHYLELIRYQTYANLKAETRRTYLGFLWWIFEPLLFLSVFYVVFGLLLDRGTENFVQFLLVGLVVWQWTRTCIGHGAMSILGNHGMMRRVHLPKLIFPLVLVLTDTVKFSLVFALLLIFLWWSGFSPGAPYLALPLLLLVQLLLTTSLTLLNAAIVPFLPDIRFVVDNLLHALFFLSGIFYRADIIPESLRVYFYLNPMAGLIEAYRHILLDNLWPGAAAIGYALLLALVLGGLALHLLRRFEYVYPRIAP